MTERLRVLVADEDRDQLQPVCDALHELGHDVIALEVGLGETALATHEHRPDLARRHRHRPRALPPVPRLLGAFDRRSLIERAKGRLMECHDISADEAFERLRRQARDSRRPLLRVVEDLLG